MSSTVTNYIQPLTQPLEGLYTSFTQLASQHRDMDDRLRSHKDDLLSGSTFTFQGSGADAFASLVNYYLDTSEKHMQAFDDASGAVQTCHSTITTASNNADAAGLHEGLTTHVLSQVSHNDIVQRGSDPIQAVINDMHRTVNDMGGSAGDTFNSLLHFHFGNAFDDLLKEGGDAKQLTGDLMNLLQDTGRVLGQWASSIFDAVQKCHLSIQSTFMNVPNWPINVDNPNMNILNWLINAGNPMNVLNWFVNADNPVNSLLTPEGPTNPLNPSDGDPGANVPDTILSKRKTATAQGGIGWNTITVRVTDENTADVGQIVGGGDDPGFPLPPAPFRVIGTIVYTVDIPYALGPVPHTGPYPPPVIRNIQHGVQVLGGNRPDLDFKFHASSSVEVYSGNGILLQTVIGLPVSTPTNPNNYPYDIDWAWQDLSRIPTTVPYQPPDYPPGFVGPPIPTTLFKLKHIMSVVADGGYQVPNNPLSVPFHEVESWLAW